MRMRVRQDDKPYSNLHSAALTGSSEDVGTYRGAVYPWHCGHMGPMDVTWYVGDSMRQLGSHFPRSVCAQHGSATRGSARLPLNNAGVPRRELHASTPVAILSGSFAALEVGRKRRSRILVLRSRPVSADSGRMTPKSEKARSRCSCQGLPWRLLPIDPKSAAIYQNS